jgi:2,3-bisphosphoglycerate-dependent phosphoglycerate mutase
MSSTLVLLRHGESEWNAKNLFTGWVDVDLTERGEQQATAGGALLRDAGLLPTVVHTSVMTRAIRTSNLALDACGRGWIPVKRHWRLNERHYGDLQGKDKKATLQEFGEEQFQLWRRSYDTPPPPIEPGSEWDVSHDLRYTGLTTDLVPRTECLKDVVHRLLPYWYDQVVPTCRPARRSWSPPTATRCAPSSSTSTGSARTRWSGSTSPRASRCGTSSTTTCTRSSPAASTWTPRPRQRQQQRWRSRAAETPPPKGVQNGPGEDDDWG